MSKQLGELHDAAAKGSIETTLQILQEKTTDINLRYGDHGWTALMVAAEEGYLRIVRVLLRHGADIAITTDHGHTALHLAVGKRHLAITKALIKAGADLEAKADCYNTCSETIEGNTPLHIAARANFAKGMTALINAGANINCQLHNGATPLYLAACLGHTQAVITLLNAHANPTLLARNNCPLDVAAQEGNVDVVFELIRRFGVSGCTTNQGAGALEAAAFMDNADIVTLLCEQGAVDSQGLAMSAAIEGYSEDCVKILVENKGGFQNIGAGAYISWARGNGNALLSTFDMGRFHAPRFARFLVDHGADTTAIIPFSFEQWDENDTGNDTPLQIAKYALQHADPDPEIDDDMVDGLKAVIRMLQQIEAVHAISWSWPVGARAGAGQPAPGGKRSVVAAMAR